MDENKKESIIKINGLLNKIDKVTNSIALEIFNEFKNKSKKFGEVNEKYLNLKRTILYIQSGREKHGYLLELIEDLLEKEMNDLFLTNHPNSV